MPTAPMRLATRLSLAGLAGLLVAPAALGQTTFTEFAFTDSTLVASPGADFWITSAAPADVDADGDFDLLVAGSYVTETTAEERLTLYRNDGPAGDTTWAFTPVPVDGLDTLSFGTGDLAWADYDADGDVDAVVAGDGEMALFRNDGGTLVRTATALPLYWEDNDFMTLDLRSLSWADYDNDGDLDLLVPSVLRPDGFGYRPTRLLRNDGPGAGDAWTFTDADVGLPRTSNAMTAWGDMDTDGDLDLMLAEISPWESPFVRLYRNEDGAMVEADTGFARIEYGQADWGDPDSDGDLDFLIAGNLIMPGGEGETVIRFLMNEGGTYTPVDILTIDWQDPEDPWLDFTAATWADYDSDGDVDLLVSGEWLGDAEILGRSLVYANDGNVFTLVDAPLPAPVGGMSGGAFTWFDIDGDGDLDYFVAGAYFEDDDGLIEARAQLFRNDAVRLNAPPAAPTALAADVAAGAVTLTWDAAADDDTPADALTYNLWVRAAPGSDIVSPMSRGNGGRMTPEAGNVSLNRSWTLRDLPDGTYAWTVQAVDNAFNGGAFAAEGTFTVGAVAAEPGAPPAALALRGVVPNPAVGGVSVVLDLPAPAEVAVVVFDALGRAVLALPAQPVEAGAGRALALDVRALPAGVYLVRVAVGRGDAVEHRTARLTVAR
jgi:hypothetical protein